MIIDFEKENNVNILDFLTNLIGYTGIKKFKGNLSEKGLPIGECEVQLNNDKVKNIKFNLDNEQNFIGSAVLIYSDFKPIYYSFTDINFGIIEYSNGAMYKGEITQFKKNGYGCYIDKMGYKIEGTFIYDKKDGEYTMTFLDNISTKINYSEDKLIGKIEKQIDIVTKLCAYYKKGKLIKAEYYNTLEEAKYIITKPYKNDDIFYNISGLGEIYFEDKLLYKGEISDTLRHGYGQEFFPDGKYFIGTFVDDKRNGKGTMYDKNDNVLFEGIWCDDEFIPSTHENFYENKKLIQVNTKKQSVNNEILSIKQSINNIENSIIGQKKAINQIANNLILSFLCEREENKPLTSILMTGPTGVGKTETAKQISEHIFHKKPFVIDFANFYGKHMLSSLIGAPSGYVGSDQTPELIKYIDENTEEGGVILFEEIDKADTECLNIFMRILDEGEILSAKNIPYSVKNFIILATTNMSANHVNTLGFSSNENDIRDTLVKTSTGMKKEQLARFNLVCEYENLTREDKIILCKKAIEETVNKLKNIKGYKIKYEYSDKIFGQIVDKANTVFGVREIKKQAAREITQKLAEFIRKNKETNLTVKIKDIDNVEILATKNKENLNLI